MYFSVFAIKRGSSSPRSLHNWITLESFSSSCPRMERPCLAKNHRFDRTFSTFFLLVAFTSSFADITCVRRHHVCLPTSRVFAGKVSRRSTASLWQSDLSCDGNPILLAVASFQLVKPRDINAGLSTDDAIRLCL